MQTATIEFARNVLKLPKATQPNSICNTPHPFIAMPGRANPRHKKGGTMRLGAQTLQLVVGTKTARLYGAFVVNERHRHCYEFNNAYRDQFEKTARRQRHTPTANSSKSSKYKTPLLHRQPVPSRIPQQTPPTPPFSKAHRRAHQRIHQSRCETSMKNNTQGRLKSDKQRSACLRNMPSQA